jgi:hypothetical protein
MPKSPRWFGRGNTRAILLASGLLALLITIPLASAAGEGQPVEGGTRNPSPNPAQTYTRETEIISNTSTYGTRQSNKSTNGGAAIYGCRSVGGQEACLRGTNLNNGLAFSFESRGPLGGRITAAGGENAKPFTTNATGVADGLNADRVDGQNAEQIVATARATAGLTAANAQQLGGAAPATFRTRWALVNEAGQIEAQSGGFSVVNCYQANANCYLDAGEDVRNNGLFSEIAVQNVGDIQGDTSSFGGETATAPCGAAFVACAPPNTERNEVLVITPRNSDGSTTTPETRKRFYVQVTDGQAG